MSFHDYLKKAPLGKEVSYGTTYDASLLCPIPRSLARGEGDYRFKGYDLWRAYELSWLGQRGKPAIALAQITIPCLSPYLIESKSFKLYLQSFSQSSFASPDEVRETIARDIEKAAGSPIHVTFDAPEEPLTGHSLDLIDIPFDTYQVAPAFLKTESKNVAESLKTDLFKAHCLVTGQPDWASIQITYEGPQIDHEGLLRYLVSFRGHSGLHEQCVERIYNDITTYCHPHKLSVLGCFTRRGGLDINPFRSSWDETLRNVRLNRQ